MYLLVVCVTNSIFTVLRSSTEEGAPSELGGAEGVAREGEDSPTAADIVGGQGEEEEGAGDEPEEDNPFRDSDEEEGSPPPKKQRLLDEGTYL